MSELVLTTPVLTPVSDFVLPEALEAHAPPEARGLTRDSVRLLVSYTGSGRIEHARFADLPGYLRPGDLVVINVSGTLPAAVTARRMDGSEVALHISTQLQAGLVVAEFRKAEVYEGESFTLPGGGSITALFPYPGSARLWITRPELPQPLLPYLARWGQPITYPYVRGSWPIEMYQTVYASVPGSAEMPSAGRPFTTEILDRLEGKFVTIAPIVLHTGVSSLEHDEAPYPEFYEVSHETAAAVWRAKKRGRRVIAVGTTAVRALETAVDDEGRPVAARGWTDLVITPGRCLAVVDGLLTGFHEPKATHLAILEALAGREQLAAAYRAALEGGYLWHEFGDLHLILPD